MLALEQVLEVKRLLDEGALSRREVAAAVGVSRGSVNAIANGERGLHGAGSDLEVDAAVEDEPRRSCLASRCRGCGGLVFAPCVLCEARGYQQAACRAA